jgi:serine/threonine-protein kinase
MAIALHEGAIFAGRYRVVRLIAWGGMGAIYEVVHLDTGRRRALKVMLPHVLHSDELRERFQREARVAADVESEFIVDVFDAGLDADTQMPFLAMELLKGEELGKRIKRAGRLPPIEAVTYLWQVALALDKTHRANIVHRDLKPENIFLTEREDGPPRVKVLDFGVAKLIAEGASSAGNTEVVGTPAYMAPEQFRSGTKITSAADVYALGLCAFTLLVGSPYYQDEATSGNAFAIALVAVRGPSEAASVRAARRGVALPQAFDAWFATVTAVDPAQRFATATMAVRALANVLGVFLPAVTGEMPRVDLPEAANVLPASSGHVTASVTPPPLHTAPPSTKPRRTGLVIASAALGALLAIAVGVVLVYKPGSTANGAKSAESTAASASAAPAATAAPSATAPAASTAASAAPPAETASASAAPPSPAPKAAAKPAAKTSPKSRPSPVYSQE